MKSDANTIMIPDNNDKMAAIKIFIEKGMISIHIISDKKIVSKSNPIRLKVTSIIPDDNDNHTGILN